jgi:hypothetical protein
MDEYDNKLIKLCLEYRIYKVHEIGWRVGQSKGHDYLLINTIAD